MTPTTYWPTYEGLRVLQADELNQLRTAEAMVDLFHSTENLVLRNNLRKSTAARAAKLRRMERIARDVLTNQDQRLVTDLPFGTGCIDV